MRDVLPKNYELHSYCIGPYERSWGEFSYARDAAKAYSKAANKVRTSGPDGVSEAASAFATLASLHSAMISACSAVPCTLWEERFPV